MPGLHYSTSPDEYSHNHPTPAKVTTSPAAVNLTLGPKYPTIGPAKPSNYGIAPNKNRRRRSSLYYSESAADLFEKVANGSEISTSNDKTCQPQPQEEEEISKTKGRNLLKVCDSCKSAMYETSAIDDEVFFSLSPLSKNRRPSQTQHRRKKSWYQSLLGSYEESLLTGRMSAPSSVPIPFHVRIGVSSTGGCGTTTAVASTKTYDQIATDFEAVFYDHDLQETGLLGRGSPYAGTVDLRAFYTQRFTRSGKTRGVLGYRVPERGKLQVVISNAERTAIELFLVDYDLSKVLGPKGKGRTFIRNKTFLCPVSTEGTTNSEADSDPIKVGKGRLVQAIHLPVAGLGKGRYYLFGEIKLTFQSKRGAGESGWLRKSDPLPVTKNYGGGLMEKRKSITVYGERGSLDTAALKYKPASDGDEETLSALAAAPTPMQERPSTKQADSCVSCEDPLANIGLGTTSLADGDADYAAFKEPSVREIANDGAKARVIRTQKQLKVEMLTDTKASTTYPKR